MSYSLIITLIPILPLLGFLFIALCGKRLVRGFASLVACGSVFTSFGFSLALLIGFWFKNQDYNDAENKAFIMNRMGDLGLIIGVILIFVHFGSINYTDVFPKADTVGTSVLTLITILLFIGAIGKSAQIPLYTWLPDAMAGPTPVSALIHAATMVTAGGYMVARNNIFYSLSPIAQEL